MFLNGYLGRNSKASYQATRTTVVDVSALNPGKRKDMKRFLDVLRTLALFSLPEDMVDPLVQLGTTEDRKDEERKVIRLAYFLALRTCECAPGEAAGARVALSPAALGQLQKDLAAAYTPRRMLALKTLGRLASDDAARSVLLPAVEAILDKIAAFDESQRDDDPKKKKKKDKVVLADRTALQYAALSVVRQRLGPVPSLHRHIAHGLVSPDKVAARHAFALLLSLARSDPAAAAPMLAAALPGAAPGPDGPVNSADTIARALLCTACGELASSPSVPADLRAEFFRSLGHFVVDNRDRVVFEAVHVLAGRFLWPELEAASIPQSEGSAALPLLPELVKAIAAALGQSSRPLLHGACRAARALAENCARHASASPPAATPALFGVLQPIVGPTHMLLDYPCVYVRAQALLTAVWAASPADFRVVASALLAELDKPAALPAPLVSLAMRALLDRVVLAPEIAPLVIEVVTAWCKGPSALVDQGLLVDLLATVMRLGPEGSHLVLATLFAIPDLGGTTLWFLGEHAGVLCGDVSVWSVILRLEDALAFGSWESRLVALEALVKIAIQSRDDISLHIYELLCIVAAEEGASLAGPAEPGLQLLDDMYAAKALIAQALEKGGADLGAVLYNAHEHLAERCRCFCDVGPGFIVPGFAPVRELMLQYYDAKVLLK